MAKRQTWQKRYIDSGKQFEWFFNFETVKRKVLPFIPKSDECRIIDLGCGTSHFTLDLCKASEFQGSVFLTDFSMEAVFHQQKIYAAPQSSEICYDSGIPCNGVPSNSKTSHLDKSAVSTEHKKSSKLKTKMTSFFLCCDAEMLPLKDHSMDLVIDKGTVDSVLKDKNNGLSRARQMLKEAARILTPGGHYIQFTDEDPDARLSLLENSLCDFDVYRHFNITYSSLGFYGNGIEYFLYVVVRK
ncbi:citrate synthase-lysine N-methyltransferase CSKMT, mitochondrial [Lingula anatina]|uniref:Citrate synthase-lysine N-methyltransferase CSKMT, mitochondrial n=1 Tax=Lingula anatina TaxID=7574 RepID=A0A1S3HCU3_LINAN|nr:citrate synthase-lysine N-methyltransferase CSKMT, mitochondrial [Lingula anatina]|eukprot:XP_013383346.1 citrate synthase-lysine N-methyltransferase CSKMT, mitochondrial [Lingula anatina]